MLIQVKLQGEQKGTQLFFITQTLKGKAREQKYQRSDTDVFLWLYEVSADCCTELAHGDRQPIGEVPRATLEYTLLG